jgi:hypothetical protein
MPDTEAESLVGRDVMVGTRSGTVRAVETGFDKINFYAIEFADGDADHHVRDEFYVLPTREQIAEELKRHYPTTGMSVASGVTCECGYWNGVESPGADRPAGAQGRDGLNWHRAQVVAALLNGDGS